jgi:hypothetical protein
MHSFPAAITKYFSFLFDYGFSIKEEVNEGSFGNGYYIFMSNMVGLEIVLDRGEVLMSIGKISQIRREWLEWSIVLAAYAPDKKPYDFDINIDSQIKRLSELLRQHCLEILTGNFSNQSLHAQIADQIGNAFLDRFLRYYPETNIT